MVDSNNDSNEDNTNKYNNKKGDDQQHACTHECLPMVIDVKDSVAIEQGATVCTSLGNVPKSNTSRLTCEYITALLFFTLFLILILGSIFLLQWVIKMVVVAFITPERYYVMELLHRNRLGGNWNMNN